MQQKTLKKKKNGNELFPSSTQHATHLGEVGAVGEALDVAHHEAVVEVQGSELGARAEGLDVAAHLTGGAKKKKKKKKKKEGP